jgi:hypothetical protein
MTISAPLMSSAKKQSVVSQCVTRTKAGWRGVAAAAGTAEGVVGMQATSLTAGIVSRSSPIGALGSHRPVYNWNGAQ